MNKFYSRVRTPVRRPGAENYLLLTLLSFAASVGLTRLFLVLTGYPQLGGGGLHIAHVLWGGLLLFVAALLPLVFSNRWMYNVSAVLSGAGVGLFIDEVGKFITSNNDYFFPAAAPIIYVFFLLTVLIYLQVRRPAEQSPRTELYCALEEFEEVLDHDLDDGERIILETRLQQISCQEEAPELARLASELLGFLQHTGLFVVPDQPTLFERWQALLLSFETRRIDHRRVRVALVFALLGLGIIAFARLAVLLSTAVTPATFADTLARMAAAGLGNASIGGLYWFLGRIIFEGIIGLMIMVGALLLFIGREQRGVLFAFYSLLISLTVVNLLVFYFDQFSTILLALLQFGALLVVIYYRRKFL